MCGTVTRAPEDEDWGLLLSFLPANWQALAAETGALKGLRKDKSAENLLRTLLIHLGCGHSLRETVVRARQGGLANLSDVALLKRLRKSRDWLYALCVELFRERGIALSAEDGFQVRAFDSTIVQEPGRTGSLWRLHYSIKLPSLGCDFFKLTATEGPSTGESFRRFPVRAGDYVLADSGYSTASGLQHVLAGGGHATVRVNANSLVLASGEGGPFDLLERINSLCKPGLADVWPARALAPTGPHVRGRICALRKTDEAIQIAHKRLRRKASEQGQQFRPETLRFACYVILFSTFPAARFSAAEILEWYRLRWQVELVFKRFKSLAQLGHLPKSDEESAHAWLYGKLLAALLAEKLMHHALAISPWGYDVAQRADSQPFA